MTEANNAIVLTELDATFELQEDASINSGDTTSYIDTLKRINKLPFSKGEIYYSDDKWDFSAFTDLNVDHAKLKYSFAGVDSHFRDDAKNYILLRILENRSKLQSIHYSLGIVRRFFNYLADKHIYKVEDIPEKTVKDYIEKIRNEKSITALRRVKTELKNFYIVYSANFQNIVTKGIMALFEQDNAKAYKAYQEENKTKDIPQDYFNKFVSACVTIMNDNEAALELRVIACVYVILSQTGLRIGEILALKDNSLKTTTIFNGEEANYLEYLTWKREKGNNVATTVKTYINALSKQAYLTLLDLHKERRETLGVDYLFVGGKCKVGANHFPTNASNFLTMAKRFFIAVDNQGLLRTANLRDDEYPTIHRFKVGSGKYKKCTRINAVPTVLVFPESQQFRFHCCTELNEKGVPLKYIQRFMSHLTTDMVRYHIHPKTSPQEDMEYSTRVLKEIVTGKTKILGDGKGLSGKIQEFIKENNYNIETDLEAICEKLADTIPIRQKTGGVCIKSSRLRDCSIDAKTNEFYCAYGVCPNIFHFYYMVDITYRQFRELKESIQININRGHRRQAEKESNMLKTVITNKFLPEMDELKEMIEKHGVSQIYMEHPELQDIIEDYDDIMKEIAKWI